MPAASLVKTGRLLPAAKCRLAQRLLLMSMAVCSSPAWADDVAVAPGGRTVIATSATEITKPSAHSPEARVAVLQDGPSWILLYTPDPSTADNRDLVSWIADAKPVTQAVRVLADAGGNVYGGSAKALFALFAIAIVLESGLALIFTWRPFLTTFNSRAVKPLVSLASRSCSCAVSGWISSATWSDRMCRSNATRARWAMP